MVATGRAECTDGRPEQAFGGVALALLELKGVNVRSPLVTSLRNRLAIVRGIR